LVHVTLLRGRPHLQGALLVVLLWGVVFATLPLAASSLNIAFHHRAEAPTIGTVDSGVAREAPTPSEPASP
jgi:hypothetical protein